MYILLILSRLFIKGSQYVINNPKLVQRNWDQGTENRELGTVRRVVSNKSNINTNLDLPWSRTS